MSSRKRHLKDSEDVPLWKKGKHLKLGDACPPVKEDVPRIYSMGFCPFAQRALLVLAAKGIKYEVVNCSLSEKPEFLLEKNPDGTVPVLEYKGNVIPESIVVSDLLEEIFPDKPLTSKDPFQKARDRIIVDKFGKVVTLFYKTGFNPDDADVRDSFENALSDFEGIFAARATPFIGGETYGMADLMIWPFIERLCVHGEDLIDTVPELKGWAQRMAAVPALQACSIPKQELLDVYPDYFARKAKYD